MRLTRFTDNALRCLLFLATRPDRPATVREVATSMGMSPDHLLKVIKRLVELGYVRTIRGRRGGVTLAVPASSINLAAVVRATEDNFALVPCFAASGSTCPVGPYCSAADSLQKALGAFFDVLQRCSIGDLANRTNDQLAAPKGVAQCGGAPVRVSP
jgi:Rrf2 family protein